MKVFAVETREIKSGLGDKFNTGFSIRYGAILVAPGICFGPLFFKSLSNPG